MLWLVRMAGDVAGNVVNLVAATLARTDSKALRAAPVRVLENFVPILAAKLEAGSAIDGIASGTRDEGSAGGLLTCVASVATSATGS